MTSLRVVHSNVHNHPSAMRKVIALGCDSVGLNEADRLIGEARRAKAYRVHAHGDNVPVPRERETPILVRRGRPNLGSMHFRISEGAKPARIAPPRVASVAVYGHPFGTIAHVNVHLNAAVMKASSEAGRVREYRESVQTLGRLLTFLRREVRHVVFSGDVNFVESADRDFSPHEMLDSHKMPTFAVGLDLVAWTPSLGQPDEKRTISAEQIGTDHPTLLVRWSR